LQDIILDGE
jgi:hypothetical protein